MALQTSSMQMTSACWQLRLSSCKPLGVLDALHTHCGLECKTISSQKTYVMVMFDVVQSHLSYEAQSQ